MILFFKNSNKRLKGLTLLETLVSITVISLTIVGPLAFMSTSSSYARQTKEALISTYLAEEAVELLQNQYDGLYVFCVKQPGIAPCTTSSGETSGQIAWRVFKERFSSVSGFASCFTDENVNGCTFDYIDMTESIEDTPPHYNASAGDCSSVIASRVSEITSYVCWQLPTHINGGALGATYKRVVYLEHLPTFEDTPRNEQDYDDVRVRVKVFYRAVNGSVRSVEIVRFIHPRL